MLLKSFPSSRFKGGKLITEEDFRNHGVQTVKPIFDDYKRLFLSPTGDFTQITTAYHAAQVLNPLTAANMSTACATGAVKELNKFEFDEFHEMSFF